MIFSVPDLNSYNALELYSNLNKILPTDKVILDFSSMSNFDPFAMLVAGSVIRKIRQQYIDIPFTIRGLDVGRGKDYAGTMGFFKYISPQIKFGKLPGEAPGSSNYIPISKICVSELMQEEQNTGSNRPLGSVIESKASSLVNIIDRGNPELHALLTYLIREILRNIPEHAETNEMWVCGQNWYNNHVAEIAIIDEGIGIYDSIIKNSIHRSYITNNGDALRWALKAGVSQSFAPSRKPYNEDEWDNSGFGLYMVSQICRKLNGNFCIASYENYFDIRNVLDDYIGNTHIHGTAILLRIPTQNVDSAKRIITDISMEGEIQAKAIRGAFKKASKPSKGLMQEL